MGALTPSGGRVVSTLILAILCSSAGGSSIIKGASFLRSVVSLLLTTLDDLDCDPSLEVPYTCQFGVNMSNESFMILVGSQTSWQIASMTATEAVAQLCSRKMTALQYAEAVLEIADTYSCLNIFSFLDRKKVRHA